MVINDRRERQVGVLLILGFIYILSLFYTGLGFVSRTLVLYLNFLANFNHLLLV